MRQTSLSAETQAIYAAVLATYEVRHLEAVVMGLGRTRREEFEKAIPELGEMEAMVKQEERTAKPPFVPCGNCVGGLVLVNGRGEPYKPTLDGADRYAKECDCKKTWRQG